MKDVLHHYIRSLGFSPVQQSFGIKDLALIVATTE